jgi:hypothetical protein
MPTSCKLLGVQELVRLHLMMHMFRQSCKKFLAFSHAYKLLACCAHLQVHAYGPASYHGLERYTISLVSNKLTGQHAEASATA